MTIPSDSRTAFTEFIALLQELDQHWASEERNLATAADVAGAHRAIMHVLEAGLIGWFECDPRYPDFRRVLSPSRKVIGDNSDAIYFDAPIDAQYEYLIHGNTHGAAYFSLTIEVDCADGRIPASVGGMIKDSDMEIDSNGNFTLYLGGKERPANWLPLPESAHRVTTRHYFEEADSAAKDPSLQPVLHIQCTSTISKPEPLDDTAIASGIRRVCNYVRARTLDMPQMMADPPPFICLSPNTFPPPVSPGNLGLSTNDAHYSMTPFFLAEDEALVIKARWPECRFANLSLWNRFQQTFDYVNRNASLNRAQTQTGPDGRFRIIVAHQDPGLPNWLDTEGHLFGLMFWRYFLVEGDIETPQAEVVKFSALRDMQ